MYHVPVFPKFKLDWRQVTAVLDIFIKARREKTSNFKQYVQKLFVLLHFFTCSTTEQQKYR
jgi:hypothetical protein